MKSIGLSHSEPAREYLKHIRGLEYAGTVADLPYFTDAKGEHHVGGHKNIYSVILGDSKETHAALDAWKQTRPFVHYSFSEEKNPYGGSRLDFILELPLPMKHEDRLKLYKKRISRYIDKNTELGVTYKIESPVPGWYGLYADAMRRFGSMAKPHRYFLDLERYFGTHIVCANAYYGGELAGALYCLWYGDYIQFFVMASKEEHRARRIHNGLFDTAIRFAIDNGIRYVDFGPTMIQDESHWALKEGFGAKRFYFSDASFTPKSDAAKRAFMDFFLRIKRRLYKYAYAARSFFHAHDSVGN